jgi:four helix bundle protein
MSNFRDLRVWQEARQFVKDTHRIIGEIGEAPGDLKDQLMRGSISVKSNIVEGSGHDSAREFIRFLRYSRASATECEGHVQVALDLDLIGEEDGQLLFDRIENIRKMLHGLVKSLSPDPRKPPKPKRQPQGTKPKNGKR